MSFKNTMFQTCHLTHMLLLLLLAGSTMAFQPTPFSRQSTFLSGATTMDPPTKERTDRKTGSDSYTSGDDEYNDQGDDDYGDLEYLIDSQESREMDDPFHILLMGATFDKPKMTVPYAASSLEYVIAMPRTEAIELSKFAKDQGMSCLGTWSREECLSFGKQLQQRDLECRVVPYCEGGQRGWQAKDMSGSNSYSGSSSSGGSFD